MKHHITQWIILNYVLLLNLHLFIMITIYIDMYIARSNVSRREQIIFNAKTVTLSIFFNFNFYHQ